MQRKPEHDNNPDRKPSLGRRIAITGAAVAVLTPIGASIALAAEGDSDRDRAADRRGGVELIDTRGTTIERALDAAELRVDYRDELDRARELGAAPADPAKPRELRPAELSDELEVLERRVGKAEREARAERREKRSSGSSASASGSKVGSPESVGVSEATLASIAACESGGDPTAISPGGDYRGKYQFDMGTWAAVGGSGDPAAAPEAEQDYRAALLYSQSGSSPWPVCG